MRPPDEPQAITARYARRVTGDARYSFLRPDVCLGVQERQRVMLQLLRQHAAPDLPRLRLLEVGSGTGGNLLEFLRMGCSPEHLSGIELLPDRHAQARHVLPAAVHLYEGDALLADVPHASQDVVLVSTVFSSVLDPAFQQSLADALWRWVRPRMLAVFPVTTLPTIGWLIRGMLRGGRVYAYSRSLGYGAGGEARSTHLVIIGQQLDQAAITASLHAQFAAQTAWAH